MEGEAGNHVPGTGVGQYTDVSASHQDSSSIHGFPPGYLEHYYGSYAGYQNAMQAMAQHHYSYGGGHGEAASSVPREGEGHGSRSSSSSSSAVAPYFYYQNALQAYAQRQHQPRYQHQQEGETAAECHAFGPRAENEAPGVAGSGSQPLTLPLAEPYDYNSAYMQYYAQYAGYPIVSHASVPVPAEPTVAPVAADRPPSSKPPASRYVGVRWDQRRKKWRAFIVVDKKQLQLGSFGSEEEAARCYDKAAAPMGKPVNFRFEGGATSTSSRSTDGFSGGVGGGAKGSDKTAVVTSKFVGVSFNRKNQKWLAQITVERKQLYLGSCDTELEAAKKYDERAAVLGKPLNLPGPGQRQAVKGKARRMTTPTRKNISDLPLQPRLPLPDVCDIAPKIPAVIGSSVAAPALGNPGSMPPPVPQPTLGPSQSAAWAPRRIQNIIQMGVSTAVCTSSKRGRDGALPATYATGQHHGSPRSSGSQWGAVPATGSEYRHGSHPSPAWGNADAASAASSACGGTSGEEGEDEGSGTASSCRSESSDPSKRQRAEMTAPAQRCAFNTFAPWNERC